MRYTTIYNDPINRSRITEPWVYWDDAFTGQELDDMLSYFRGFELTPGKTFEEDGEEDLNTDRRRSLVKFHGRNDQTAWIFDRINFIVTAANERFYNFNLNGYETFQYTEYHAEQEGYYDWHMDMCLGHDKANLCDTRKLSLSLCLNDDYEGGEFLINNGSEKDPIRVPTKRGRAILFPSWMIHTVTPVTKSTRSTIVVWVMGPKWT
jgi:PKHD-type hydroxylase